MLLHNAVLTYTYMTCPAVKSICEKLSLFFLERAGLSGLKFE